MITYFHHINYGEGRTFHHGWFWEMMKRRFRLEIYTGRALRFEFQRGEAGDGGNECRIGLGLLFFSLSFTFPVSDRWLIKRKCIATWDNNREFYLVDGRLYGFYFHDWAFVWSWHQKVNESSSRDPWWMHQYIRLDELVLGKPKLIRDELSSTSDVWFRLGGKEFKIDSIAWARWERFRTRIPFSLWHQADYHVDIKISAPPMRSGKGENSWDCGDDGTFGMGAPWKGPAPRWDNMKETVPAAVALYVDHVLKDAKKYGGSDGERGIRASDVYEYIGRKESVSDVAQQERQLTHKDGKEGA